MFIFPLQIHSCLYSYLSPNVVLIEKSNDTIIIINIKHKCVVLLDQIMIFLFEQISISILMSTTLT